LYYCTITPCITRMQVIVSFALIFIIAQAYATQIGIYGTGLRSDGSVAVRGTEDIHWKISGSAATVATTVPNTFASSTSSAQWIGLANDLNGEFGTNTWSYTTFDLSGLDPSTASLSGQYAVDDTVEIYLNGVSTSISCTGTSCYSTRTNFAITSGFQHGVNTLTFRVNNFGGPSGLLVSVSGTAYTAVEFCNTLANKNDWTYGQGYYCWNGGVGFLQCWGDTPSFSQYHDCGSETSCKCPRGAECSNGGTTTPCTGTLKK